MLRENSPKKIEYRLITFKEELKAVSNKLHRQKIVAEKKGGKENELYERIKNYYEVQLAIYTIMSGQAKNKKKKNQNRGGTFSGEANSI